MKLNEIDYLYRDKCKYIIKQKLVYYPQIPITWEDIYFSYLNDYSKIKSQFKIEKNTNFVSWYLLNLKFYTRNMIKKYSTSGFKILNKAFSIDNFIPITDLDIKYEINYQTLNYFDLDIVERQIINLKYHKNLNWIMVSKKLSISILKLKKIDVKLKLKMKKLFLL
ncbi:MAG: hypothetical protein E7Y34_02235 [Mycoplasma sp.]|nr:hypothetical protein [Mycoplasma sp.]